MESGVGMKKQGAQLHNGTHLKVVDGRGDLIGVLQGAVDVRLHTRPRSPVPLRNLDRVLEVFKVHVGAGPVGVRERVNAPGRECTAAPSGFGRSGSGVGP